MKKLIGLAILVLTVCLFFAACGCEHAYEEAITTPASCTATGLKTFTCTLCQDSYTEEIPMEEHDFSATKITKKATCKEKGELGQVCESCGFTKVTQTIPVTNHTYKDVVTKEATCNEEGTLTPTCDCGATKVSTKIPKLTHNYEGKVIKEATYKKTGTKQFTCTHCGDQYTKSIAKLSITKIIDKATAGSKYINKALDYMNDGLTYYKYNKHSSGQMATSYMLVNVGLAINQFKAAYDLCGDHPELSEIKTILAKIISRLEYVKKYSTVTTSNYFSIIKDIVYSDVFQDVVDYQKQLTSVFATFA